MRFFDGRVGAEEALDGALFQRVSDEESFGSRVLAMHGLGVSIKFL